MKIDFTTLITDLNELPIKNDRPGATGPLTLANVAIEALLANYNDEPQLSGQEKFNRWNLAKKIHQTPLSTPLESEEIAEIKKLIGKGYGPLVVGQAFEILEGKSGLSD